MKPSSARQILLAIVFVSYFLSGCSPSSPTGGDVTPQSAIDPISESEQEKFDAFLKFLLRYGSTINPTTGKVDTIVDNSITNAEVANRFYEANRELWNVEEPAIYLDIYDSGIMAATQAKYILITTATRAEKDVEKYKTLGNRAGILALKLLDDLGFNNDEAFKIVRNTNPKLFYLYALLGYWTPNGINIGPGNQTLVPNYEDSLLLWNPGIPEISLSESDGQHRGYWSNPAAIDPEFQGPYTLEAIQQGYHIVFRILTNEILNMLEATSEDENSTSSEDENNPRLKREQLIRLLSESGIDFEDVENMSNEDLARNTSWFLLYKEWLYLRFPYQSYYPGVICSFDDFKPEDA